MMRERRRHAADTVSTEDRLGEYVVTRPPPGAHRTGLPGPFRGTEGAEADEPLDAALLPAGLHVVEEQRGESRHPATLRVHSSHPGADTAVDGVTVDISRGGMCLEMPEPPPEVHQDVEVDDGETYSAVWALVVSYDEVDTGVYRWHVRVTAADDAWETVVAAVSNSPGHRQSGRRAQPA